MMLRGIAFRALECFVVLAEELHFDDPFVDARPSGRSDGN
jgi:hypothetical protein